MNKIITVEERIGDLGEVILSVLKRLGFRCSCEDGDCTAITILGEPARVNPDEVYGRLNRVQEAYDRIKSDLAHLDMAGDESFYDVLRDNGRELVEDIEEHSRAHLDGVPDECVFSVVDNSRLPESLVRALYEFAEDGNGALPRVRGEMRRFLS